MNQLTFDELRRSRSTDPETSRDAARQAGQLAADHQFRILAVLREASGRALAPHQIADRAGLDPVQVSRRIRELADSGAIVEGGVAPTPSGRSARTWRLAL